ncbi:hypothetical protein IAQ61_004505 [Plenodomus lingam]|uniref:uncharacterized protein n=1 Tax=Leptosphaeria maculans TaxID=5022 RepID=UPI003330AFB4|nr:hypothetical protein IAQ61_004505 [Plenodomus lingam]
MPCKLLGNFETPELGAVVASTRYVLYTVPARFKSNVFTLPYARQLLPNVANRAVLHDLANRCAEGQRHPAFVDVVAKALRTIRCDQLKYLVPQSSTVHRIIASSLGRKENDTCGWARWK